MRFNLPSGNRDTNDRPTYMATAKSSSSAIGLSKMAMANRGIAMDGPLVEVTTSYQQKAGE